MNETIVPETLQYRLEGDDRTALVLARVRIRGMEKSHIWRAALQNNPEGTSLCRPMSQPFMSFKEGREALGKFLGVDPMKLQFMAFRGSRTYFPTDEQKRMLLVDETIKTHKQRRKWNPPADVMHRKSY